MKNSNFKKVLALVLSLAMVLSVCLTGFAVSAETEEAVDLSYYLLNDGTKTRIYKADGSIANNWSNGSSQVAVKHNGRDVLRIAPQREGKTHLSFNTTPDSTVDYSAVNTLSYYVKNETGAPLKLRYQYYEDNGTHGNFNGYVYLVAADEAEILPYLTDDAGNITLPAKFEGYVVYDLSASDNYGNVSINLGDGNWDNTNPTVDYIKNTKKFAGLSMFVDVTADMLTKAWYLDDIAISTKTVEELAKYLTGGKVISYNFNLANAGGYGKDDAINFWGVSLDKWDLNNVNGPANLVDFGNLDGTGSQFPRIAAGGYHDGALGLNNAFVESIGTDLPYALENAKAIKISVENKGTITLAFRVAGSANYLFGSYISVADDGTVTTSAKFPTNFSGDTYFIFDDMAVSTGWSNTPTYTWANFIKSRTGDFNMNAQIAGGAAGDVLTVGGFSFVYELTEILELKKKAVFIDGNAHYEGWLSPNGGGQTTYRGTQWGNLTNESIDGKYVFYYDPETCPKTGQSEFLYMKQGNTKAAVENPEAIKAISFELKLTGWATNHGLTFAPTFLKNSDYNDKYTGNLKAISRDGTVVAEATTNASYNNDGNGNYTLASGGTTSIRLPNGFDGIIIMEFNDSPTYINKNSLAAGTEVYTFEQFVALNGGFTGISAHIDDPWDAGSAFTKMTIETDNYRFVDDVEAFVADYTSEEAEAERVAAEEAKAAAKAEDAEKELLTGTHVVNTFTGADGNTATHTTNNANVVNVTYGSNDSADGACAEMVFNSTNATSGQRRVNLAVNKGVLDLSRAVGFTYDVNITNPDAFAVEWSLQVIAQKNALKNVKVYFIDANTGAVTDMGVEFTNKATVKGTVVVLFGEDYAVQDGYGDGTKYTWADFVAANSGKITDIGLWMSDRKTTTVEEPVLDETTGEPTGETVTKTVLTDACANFKAQIDSLSFIYEKNPILAKIDSILNPDTESYFAPVGDLTKTTFASWNSLLNFNGNKAGVVAPFTPTVDWNVNTPSGLAYKFNKVETTWNGVGQFKIMNRSGLSNAELAEKEAIAFWVKVPEGETIALNLCLNDEPYTTRTSVMAYDVVKNEAILVENPTAKDNYVLDLSGFEGYVIVPLQNALFGKDKAVVGDHTGPMAYKDYVAAKGITQLYFYLSKANYSRITSAFWMSEFQFVDSLSEFFGKIGAETTPGDINYDGETDLRDIVRLKKFNASAKTAIAYQNADVDGNGLFDTAAELVNIKKQNMGVDYKAPEIDASLVKYPETMVGLYHHSYGEWDSKYADIAAEKDIVNMYSTTDLYTLAQLKENGGFAWFYMSESFAGEPIFGTKDGGFDRTATEINKAYKAALDEKVQQLKKLGLWNTIVGFTDEELLIGADVSGITQAQYAIWTKYLKETYGKRFNACLSTYEVLGSTETNTPAATPETYAYVTDIGYDWYTGTLEQHKTMLNALMTNTGNRSDVKYWFYPTAYSPDSTGDRDLVSPARDDATIAAQIEIFSALADEVPAGQLGGYYFYTWRDWGNSWGLETLIEDYDYTATADALVALASKYVK